jgi:hypothetical protein
MSPDHLVNDRMANGLDLALGSLLVVAAVARRAVTPCGRVLRPLAGLGLRPPLVGPRWHPERLLRELSDRGRANRSAAAARAEELADDLIPSIVSAVLDRLDLTALVLDRVDLDAVAGRLDLQSIVARVDVDAVAARVDLDRIVARLDLNQIAEGIDVDRIAARVDLDAIVDRLDVLALVLWVIDSIDLPGIIRESSSSVASETMRGVRMVSIEADQTVSRVMGRLLMRRQARDSGTPWGQANASEPGADDGAELP